MKDKLDKLEAKYPKVFGVDGDMHRFRTWLEPGWVKIVEAMVEKLNDIKLPKDFRIQQIKEKFGLLRVYAHPHSKIVQEIIDEAEALNNPNFSLIC